ncbi:MAG: hypothetical protein KIT68_00845 [Phycisphaeraceae bacterium]|nr:hypothetical protein [Phycisphaeraceae bacterium]
MNRQNGQPALRLVNSDVAQRPGALPGRHTRPTAGLSAARTVSPAPSRTGDETRARRDVARANVLASGMMPDDARWIFALRAADALEGGVAAIIRPEVRRKLVDIAVRLGLRPFDANLIIAIVQDGRRSGRGALNPDCESRLTLVRPADPPVKTANWLGPLIGLTILACMATYVMCAWVARAG